jgi:Ca2+-binding RTX toxin-like protein
MVTVSGGAGADTMTINDSATGFSDGYSITSAQVTRTGLARTIRYSLLEGMTLLAESGANTITVVSTLATTPVTIDAGGGSDTLVGPNLTNLWQITAADAGTVGNVTFRAAERLTGGSGADTFRFGVSGSVSGSVNGGAGRNALDYSLFDITSPIFVDLGAGQASRIGAAAVGVVSGVQDAIGGAGADTLIGSSADNILRGGGSGDVLRGGLGNDVLIGGAGDDFLEDSGGRNLLIGGDGKDTAFGAGDDDIMIAGYTSFDAASAANDASLMSIVAEWTSARAYTDRVDNLSGIGLGPRANGSVFLKSSGIGQTVFSDPYADGLTGAAGMDWFFDVPPDTTDAVAGERHN